MAADNHTTIVGNLVDDPEVRFTNTGIAVANLRVAVTQRIQQDGEWRDAPAEPSRASVTRPPRPRCGFRPTLLQRPSSVRSCRVAASSGPLAGDGS